MTERLLFDLVSILVLGIGAQWLGWRLRIPAILPLLLFGLLAGPLTGYVRPDELLGDLLLPIVSLSVAIILFEGGLTLNIRELPAIGRALWRLLSLGVLVAWTAGAGAAYWLLGLDLGLAVLLGALLVVTGPTVIGPLLRSVRPSGPALHRTPHALLAKPRSAPRPRQRVSRVPGCARCGRYRQE